MAINHSSEWLGRAVSWLTLLMVLITMLVVVLRYAFSLGWVGLQESISYLHVVVFMLGMPYTLLHDKHVRIDIFYQRYDDIGKAWVDMLGTVFLLLPMLGFIVFSSWDYVADSWAVREGSRSSGGLPLVYLLKSTLPLMAVLLFLQAVSILAQNLIIIFQPRQTNG